MSLLITIILFSLVILTAAIWRLQRHIWKKYPNIVFPIFIGIFYYWSLAGSWLFVFDQTTHWGEKIGIHYHYLLEKMFMVQLDQDYLLSIWIIGGFIITLQLTLLILIQKLKLKLEEPSETPFKNILYFPFIAMMFLIISIYIVYDVISYSLILNESIYLNIRSPHVPYYSLHQLACWIMMVSLTIPLALQLRNTIKNNQPFSLPMMYWIVFGIAQFYLIFIGSRHEAFLCGLATILFISYPYQNTRAKLKLYSTILIVWIVVLFLNDPFRSLSPVVGKAFGLTAMVSTEKKINEAEIFREDRTFINHHNATHSQRNIESKNNRDTTFIIQQDTIVVKIKNFEAQRKVDQEFIVYQGKKYKIPNPHISKAYQESSVGDKIFRAASGILFSNELFAGHFSIYGVVHYKIPTQLGISFNNLFFSFIPSFIRKERPIDVYGYYVQQLNLPKDQGFTINHIAAWIINFGWAGIILGPMLLGFILMSPFIIGPHIWKNLPPNSNIFILVMITCFGAMLVRSGPEGIKSILYEAILIPAGLLWSYPILQRIIRRKSS